MIGVGKTNTLLNPHGVRVPAKTLRFAAYPDPRAPYVPPPEPRKKGGFWNRVAQMALLLQFASLGYMGHMLHKIYGLSKGVEQEMLVRAENRLDQHAAPNPWPRNTKVYTSTIQETSAWGSTSDGFLYPNQLFEALNKPTSGSIDQAHQTMEKGVANMRRAFNGIAQVPVASTGPAQGWVKGEEKERFVLIVSGDGLGGEAAPESFGDEGIIDQFKRKLFGGPEAEGSHTLLDRYRYEGAFHEEMAKVKYSLQKHYNVPEESFKQLIQPDRAELKKAFVWLQEMQKQNPGAEALVYFVGHGNAEVDFSVPEDQWGKQGAASGYVGLSALDTLDEVDMKKLFQEHLKDYSAVTLIMAPCHSGAWIAKNMVQQPDASKLHA